MTNKNTAISVFKKKKKKKKKERKKERKNGVNKERLTIKLLLFLIFFQ